MDNKVDVVIGGEIVTLKSSESADYLQRIARYADEKIEEIKSKSKMAAIDERARGLLIALNIADDYHKALDKFSRLDSLHKRFISEMGKLQNENAQNVQEIDKLKAELASMQKELDAARIQLASTQKELEEFIKSFDTENIPEGENILTLPQKPRKTAAR